MSFKYKIFAIVMAAVLAIMTFGGCSLKKTDSADSGTSVSDEDMFTERDLDASYEESSSAKIALADGATKSDSDNVKTDGDAVEITGEGTYIISGTLTNGRIIINAKDSDKIQLVLNGANINCDTGAAIYVKQADKVFITLAPSSENTLSNKRESVAVDDNNIDSVIFSKSDLTLNGSGELTVNAAYGHGIVSKDDLVLTGGEYSITSEKQALSGKDSIRVADGAYTLNAGKDGLHSENTDDTSKGFIYIANGTFDITCDCDGIDASGTVTVKNGNINNLDLRYEFFGENGDMFSATAYYKHLEDPIEQIQQLSGGATIHSFQNANNGMAAGLEVEFRKELIRDLRLGANASFMYTDVKLPEGGAYTNTQRALQGASPYLVNADITYTPRLDDVKQLSAALVYNLQGPRIQSAGISGLGDVKQQPVHTMNFVGSFKFNEKGLNY